MSRAAAETLEFGAIPRARLLPPEIEAAKKARSLRRTLVAVLIAAVVAVFVGVGAATLSVLTANTQLTAEQSRTAGLLLEQRKYGSVVTVESQVGDIKTVQPVAALGEILWQPFTASLQAALPAGMSITSVDESLDKAAASSAAVVPLQGAHVATIIITASSPQAPISDWLDNLASIKGFVDAVPGSVNLDSSTGKYTSTVTLHVNSDAFSGRFATGKK
jgi:Tfp pilus assembly protein PilN